MLSEVRGGLYCSISTAVFIAGAPTRPWDSVRQAVFFTDTALIRDLFVR